VKVAIYTGMAKGIAASQLKVFLKGKSVLITNQAKVKAIIDAMAAVTKARDKVLNNNMGIFALNSLDQLSELETAA
jgi:hypothetical protein